MVMEKQAMRMQQLLERSDAYPGDLERQALFFILAGNEDLYSKVNSIYDFEENIIKNECLDGGVDLSSGSRNLVKLGYNLFNGFEASVTEVFEGLDEENKRLAIEAIKIRFKIV